jgi:transcriptional regulator with XRE-family HTH domain
MAVAQGPIPEWTFGERLEKARKERHLSQEDMAAIMDVSPATISNWETGARKPVIGEIELASRWAKETDCDEIWLLKGAIFAKDGSRISE